MSIVGTKIRHPVTRAGKLFDVDFIVAAIHVHPAQEEVSIHLRSKLDDASTFDMVLTGDDRTAALSAIVDGSLRVGSSYTLQLA
jgi:hypothetical protein